MLGRYYEDVEQSSHIIRWPKDLFTPAFFKSELMIQLSNLIFALTKKHRNGNLIKSTIENMKRLGFLQKPSSTDDWGNKISTDAYV